MRQLRTARWVALLSLVLCSLALWAKPAEEGLTAGFAEADITPKVAAGGKPVYLAGFGKNRKATGVHDPLLVRAVVLGHGKQKVTLVSVDVVGLFHPFVERIRKQLPGFDHILVSSTHNHEGPDTLGLWGASPLQSGVDPDYMASLEKQIVKAVRDADAGRKKTAASIGSVKTPELLHDGRLPLVLHDELVVLHFEGAGIVVQWNCHPETLGGGNKLVSADYVGYTIGQLRKKFGVPVVYLTGTVGGLMTSLHVPIQDEKGKALKDGTYEKTGRYGVLLAQAAEKALKAKKAVSLTPFTVRSRQIYLPLDNKLYVAASMAGVFDRESFLWKDDPYKAEAVKMIDPKKRHAVRTEVAYLRFGQLDVACIPGEIYPELVLDKVPDPAEKGADFPDAPIEPAIYKQMAGPYRMLIGLANDEIGYIIPRRQWDTQKPFAYGKERAQYGEVNSLGPETAPLLCAAFRDLVKGKK